MDAKKLIEGKRGFLFDFDGVVTDSEPFAFETLKSIIFNRFGVVIDDSDVGFTIGLDDRGVAKAMHDKYGIAFDGELYERLLASAPSFYIDYEGIRPFPYLPEFLGMIRRNGGKTAVVSSTRSPLLRVAIERMGLSWAFDAIIGADMVEKKKPFPEPYLKGMEVLGTGRSDSIAFEDSPYGIQAAKSAGIPVIAFKGSVVKQNTEKADGEISGYDELL